MLQQQQQERTNAVGLELSEVVIKFACLRVILCTIDNCSTIDNSCISVNDDSFDSYIIISNI